MPDMMDKGRSGGQTQRNWVCKHSWKMLRRWKQGRRRMDNMMCDCSMHWDLWAAWNQTTDVKLAAMRRFPEPLHIPLWAFAS
jgi:hypothetical protein